MILKSKLKKRKIKKIRKKSLTNQQHQLKLMDSLLNISSLINQQMIKATLLMDLNQA